MKKLMQKVRQSVLVAKAKGQRGATMVEYALMVALIAAVCIATVTAIGTSADAKFEKINAALIK
jgi:pilus assembly protein Flp/PilA